MYKGTISITLKSDLCTGSGYSFAGIIDQDVCYDHIGLPYIPARRLKGCFRETAVTALYALFSEESIQRIFGREGNAQSGCFRLGNAYIANYRKIREQLEAEAALAPGVICAQSVFGQYSRVTGQTRLSEEGSADPGTLRFTRIITHFDPLSDEDQEKEFVFEADFSADLSENDMETLKTIICATRMIGLKRNRGLGNVMIGVDYKEAEALKPLPPVSGSDTKKQIKFTVRNLEPLMLSGEREDYSEFSISARSLQGALAACFLKHPEWGPDTDVFRDLFLNGTVLFSDLNPCAGKTSLYPVPEYINKLKVTKKIVNILDETGMQQHSSSEEDPFNPQAGNKPKKMKNTFMAFDGEGKAVVLEPRREMAYHHSHHKLTDDNREGMLYGMEVMAEEQDFCGTIELPEKYAALVLQLLKEADLSFGKSRSVQYGKCILKEKPEITDAAKGEVIIKAGEKIVLTCLSDLALFDIERGDYTVYRDRIGRIVSESLSKAAESAGKVSFSLERSLLKTGKVTGYNTTWNLRTAPVPCLKAGSAFVFVCSGECRLPEYMYLGEMLSQGCGRVRLQSFEKMTYIITEAGKARPDKSENHEADKLIRKIKRDRWLLDQKSGFLKDDDNVCRKLSASGIGRLTLMLKESLGESKEYRDQYVSFGRRIGSIKSEDLKSAGQELFKIFGRYSDDPEGISFDWLEKDTSVEEKDREYYRETWGDCLMATLVFWKYKKGEKA